MKLKKIKFENIFFILMLIYGIVAIQHHICNKLISLDIIVYFLQALLVRYSIKYVRLNPKEFAKEIKDLFNENGN